MMDDPLFVPPPTALYGISSRFEAMPSPVCGHVAICLRLGFWARSLDTSSFTPSNTPVIEYHLTPVQAHWLLANLTDVVRQVPTMTQHCFPVELGLLCTTYSKVSDSWMIVVGDMGARMPDITVFLATLKEALASLEGYTEDTAPDWLKERAKAYHGED